MVSADFEFALGAHELWAPSKISGPTTPWGEPELPSDYADWVDLKDDRFRDAFTRISLYLASRHVEKSADTTRHLVVSATEYGNLGAIVRFLKQGREGDSAISAQQFPQATASSAATYVNLSAGIQGGTVTLNAGGLNPAMALLHAFLHLQVDEEGLCHVFLGDTYCAEASDDIRKRHPNRSVTPGLCYAALRAGKEFFATISFSDADAPRGTEVASDQLEHNAAFEFSRMMAFIGAMPTGKSEIFHFESDGRSAAVRIRK